VALDYQAAQAQLQPSLRSFMNSDARSGSDVGSQYGVSMDRQFASGANFGIGYYDSTFGNRNLSELRFNYTLPFFSSRGEDIRRSLDDASFALSQESARTRITALEVERAVLRQYFDVVLADAELELAQRAAGIAAEGSEAIGIRVGGGQASALDVQRAEMASAQAAFRAVQAEQGLADAKDQLRVIIGAPLDEPFRIDAVSAPRLDPALIEMPVGQLLDRALLQRLDVIEAGRALATVERRINTEHDRRLPDVEVSLQYALVDETGYAGQTLEDQRFGIGLRMNTDFKRQAGDREETRRLIELRERERQFAYVRQNVELDVKRARANVDNLAAQLQLSRRASALAEAEYQRAGIMTESGALGRFDLLQLQLQLNESEHRIRALEAAHQAALYDLQLATGGRLE
jgi:outer membrane protein TolC